MSCQIPGCGKNTYVELCFSHFYPNGITVVPTVVKPPQSGDHPMLNPAEKTTVVTSERISTACASPSQPSDFLGSPLLVDPDRSAHRSASGEARHPPGALIWAVSRGVAHNEASIAAGECACGRRDRPGDHGVMRCEGRELSLSSNPTVAARWARLAEVVDLPPDEMLKLTFAELALILESRVMRLRHQALAAGAPAVAGEFYVKCTGCSVPVDVRTPHAVACDACALTGDQGEIELVTCSNAERA